MKTSLKIEGLKELDAALAELPQATSKNVMRRAAKKALGIVIDAAIPNVPVDEGALKKSMKVSTRLSKRQAALARREFKTEGKAAIVMYAGPSAFPHAHLIEFGTKPRYQKKTGKFVGQVRARPFMRPAWDSKRAQVLVSFQSDMWTEIEKATKRLARKAARAAKASEG
jgi:HK97 gp10 family phage protein